jgi:hypothetical protein
MKYVTVTLTEQQAKRVITELSHNLKEFKKQDMPSEMRRSWGGFVQRIINKINAELVK